MISRIECTQHLAFPTSTTYVFHSHLPRRILVMQMYKFCGCTLERLGLRRLRGRETSQLFASLHSTQSQTPQLLSEVEKNESNVSSVCRPTTERGWTESELRRRNGGDDDGDNAPGGVVSTARHSTVVGKNLLDLILAAG